MELRRFSLHGIGIGVLSLVVACQPRAVVVLERAPEGSFRECLERHGTQGMGVLAAMRECNEQMERLDDIPSLGGIDPGGLLPQDRGSIVTACVSGGVDPRLGYTLSNGTELRPRIVRLSADERRALGVDPTQDRLEWTAEQERQIKEDLDKAVRDAVEALQKTPEYKAWKEAFEKAAALGANDPGKAAADQAADAAWDKMTSTKEWAAKERAEGRRAAGVPQYTQPKQSQPNRFAEDVCRGIAEETARCNEAGWNLRCERILARLRHCADPLIARPAPDGDTTCGAPEVDPDEAVRVAVLACRSRTRPVPGEDPCVPRSIEGDLHRYRYRVDPNGAPVPCTDPRAMPGEDQCTGSFSLVEFGRKDLQKLIADAREKFGGPIIILPLPAPTPPGPAGPRPE